MTEIDELRKRLEDYQRAKARARSEFTNYEAWYKVAKEEHELALAYHVRQNANEDEAKILDRSSSNVQQRNAVTYAVLQRTPFDSIEFDPFESALKLRALENEYLQASEVRNDEIIITWLRISDKLELAKAAFAGNDIISEDPMPF